MDAVVSAEATGQAAEVRYICVKGPDAYYGVLSFYSVLAYPSRSEWDHRQDFARAMCARNAKSYLLQGGDRNSVPQIYRQFKNEKITGQLNRGFRRIGWRLSAASVAYGICLNGIRMPYDTPSADGSVGVEVRASNTVNGAVKKLVEDKQGINRGRTPPSNYVFEADVVNVKSRIWAKSKPVLHLALALYQNVGVIMNKSDCQLSDALIALSHNEAWFGPALLHAEKWRSQCSKKVPEYVAARGVCLRPTEDISIAYQLVPRIFPSSSR